LAKHKNLAKEKGTNKLGDEQHSKPKNGFRLFNFKTETKTLKSEQ
jgi:hypothetical protein